MDKLLIEPYFSLLTPGQKEELIDEYLEIEGCLPDDDYFRHEKWANIYDMTYKYYNEEIYLQWDYYKDPYYNEVKQLNTFTQRFTDLQHSYIERGLIAWEIKYKKLYKLKYRNFDNYCKAILKLSGWQINRIINASRIALLLINSDFEYIPTCESQARVLVKYSDDDIIDYWGEITEKYKGKEYELTSKQIWKEIRLIRLREGEEVEEGKWRIIKIRIELYKKLMAEAIAHNLSLIEYFEYCIGDLEFPKSANYSPVQIKITNDLEKTWTNTT